MGVIYMERVTSSATQPKAATAHAACMDIYADVTDREIESWQGDGEGYEFQSISPRAATDMTLEPGERALIPTGFKMCCDPGYRIAMYPRSGLAVKCGLTLTNCVGVIDADYRGEVMVPVINLGNEPTTIRHGDRIAQMALERLEPTNVLLLERLPETDSDRNGGFGSTGV